MDKYKELIQVFGFFLVVGVTVAVLPKVGVGFARISAKGQYQENYKLIGMDEIALDVTNSTGYKFETQASLYAERGLLMTMTQAEPGPYSLTIRYNGIEHKTPFQIEANKMTEVVFDVSKEAFASPSSY